MELSHVLFITFLVSPSFSFPSPKGGPRGANSTVDEKTLKFPSSTDDLKNRSDPVRSPSGAWSGKRGPGSSGSKDVRDHKFVPKIQKRSPKCTQTFCEDVDDYPSSYIENVLPNAATEYRSLFGKDIVPENKITHRIDSSDEVELCPSYAQIVYPKTAKNKDDKWLYIINHGEYVQGVRVEKCLSTEDSDSQPCFRLKDNFSSSYKPACKQKYILRKMLALDENGQTITDSFVLPSCCSCTLQPDRGGLRIGDPGSRMSSTRKPSTSS